MSTRSDRKPESELRLWSTYASVGEWYDVYHGYVPSMMAVGLSQLMRKHPELTFPEQPNLRRALEELQFFSSEVRVLGVYPASAFRLTQPGSR